MNRTTRGALIALSVAALFGTRSATADSGDNATHEGKTAAKIACAGINACKGKGECASATHSCGGLNECKGKGIVMTSEADCKAKGGKVVN
jgi:hypothetical protein